MTLENKRMEHGEVESAIAGLDGWQLVDEKLYREFRFDNFVEATGFMMRAAVWAEMLNHHPDWSNLYDTVRVSLETHDVGGISQLDIQLATKMNELASN